MEQERLFPERCFAATSGGGNFATRCDGSEAFPAPSPPLTWPTMTCRPSSSPPPSLTLARPASGRPCCSSLFADTILAPPAPPTPPGRSATSLSISASRSLRESDSKRSRSASALLSASSAWCSISSPSEWASADCASSSCACASPVGMTSDPALGSRVPCIWRPLFPKLTQLLLAATLRRVESRLRVASTSSFLRRLRIVRLVEEQKPE